MIPRSGGGWNCFDGLIIPPRIPPRIEINDEFTIALKLLEDIGKSIFITGKASTGKSILLQYFRENTDKSVAVLAPTGVAA